MSESVSLVTELWIISFHQRMLAPKINHHASYNPTVWFNLRISDVSYLSDGVCSYFIKRVLFLRQLHFFHTNKWTIITKFKLQINKSNKCNNKFHNIKVCDCNIKCRLKQSLESINKTDILDQIFFFFNF